MTQQPKLGSPQKPVTIPLKVEASAKDIQAELSNKVKDVQVRLQLGLIGQQKALTELQAIEAEATRLGRQGGANMAAYADGARAAHSALEGLKKGTQAALDPLTVLTARFAYAGKSGLSAYTKGLEAYIAQQERAAGSAKAGSKEEVEAMQNVTRARELLKSATEKANETDLEREQRSRREQFAQQALEKAIRSASEARLKSIVAAGVQKEGDLARIEAAQRELDRRHEQATKEGEQARKDAQDAAKARQAALESVAQAVRQGNITAAGRHLDEAKRLQAEEVNAAGLTADQKVKIYQSSTGEILSAAYQLHAAEKRQADASVDEWAKSEQAKALTTKEREAEAARRRAKNRETERQANLSAQREQAALLKAGAEQQRAERERLSAADIAAEERQRIAQESRDAAASWDWLLTPLRVQAERAGQALDETQAIFDYFLGQVKELRTQNLDPLSGDFLAYLENIAKGSDAAALAAGRLLEQRDKLLTAPVTLSEGVAPALADHTKKAALGPADYAPARSSGGGQPLTADLGRGELQRRDRENAWNDMLESQRLEVYKRSLKELSEAELDLALSQAAVNEESGTYLLLLDEQQRRSNTAKENVEALRAAREKLQAAQEKGTAKFTDDIRALEKLRGQPGVVAAELDTLIAAYGRLEKQAALEAKVNEWSDYAKQLVPVVAAGLGALGSVSEEVAQQWSESFSSMVSDLSTFAAQLAQHN